MLRSLLGNPLHRRNLLFSPTPHHLLHTTTQPTATDPPASYLTTALGLSPAAAASATAKLRRRRPTSPSNPDAVLRLLRSRGFTPPQLARLVATLPIVLHSDPAATLQPKLDFLLGVLGLSPEHLSAEPHILCSSLERRLKPSFASLAAAFASPEAAAAALRRHPGILRLNLQGALLQNLDMLQRCGVELPRLVKLAFTHRQLMRGLLQQPAQLAEAMEQLKQMGVCPSSKIFIYALLSMASLKASAWERKLSAYRALGWSDAETLAAFSKFPYFMLNSEEKIKKMVEFFAEELGWGREVISSNPSFLSMSLEKRVVPRLSVWRVLASEGVVQEGFSPKVLRMTEKLFLGKFVNEYGDKYPEVYRTYQGKLGAAELEEIDS